MNINLLDPASFAEGQPHEQFRWLRDNAPVYRHPEPDGPGFWAVTRYDDVRDVGRDPHHYSSVPTIMIPDYAGIDFGGHQMMITSDPPRHTRLRRIINSQFTPRAAERLRLRIDELAAEIIDAVIERGECDAVTDIAGEMPSFVIAELLGIPLDDGRRLYHLTETIHAAPETMPPGAGLNAIIEMFNYAHDVAEDKRAHPGDDLASRILGAEVDGERLDEMQFDLFFLLLSVAGNETTRNLISHGMHALIEHPEQRQRLLDDPSLLPTGIEEMLRWATPVMSFRRTATHDTEIAGQAIAEGDKVVIWYISANRDESVFEEPFRFDVGRSPNDHITFGGGGPHFCLGSHLAKLEIRIMFEELLRRLPDMELDGPVQRLRSNFINGIKHMPVRYTPSPRLAS